MDDDRNDPATKADITTVNGRIDMLRSDVNELRSDVNQRIDMLRSEFQHSFDELKETMRDAQTELLKAFYNYAQSADAKLKEGEVADFLIRGRLTAMESRQTDMERRLNTPPPQQ
jgi:hypothetical protein